LLRAQRLKEENTHDKNFIYLNDVHDRVRSTLTSAAHAKSKREKEEAAEKAKKDAEAAEKAKKEAEEKAKKEAEAAPAAADAPAPAS